MSVLFNPSKKMLILSDYMRWLIVLLTFISYGILMLSVLQKKILLMKLGILFLFVSIITTTIFWSLFTKFSEINVASLAESQLIINEVLFKCPLNFCLLFNLVKIKSSNSKLKIFFQKEKNKSLFYSIKYQYVDIGALSFICLICISSIWLKTNFFEYSGPLYKNPFFYQLLIFLISPLIAIFTWLSTSLYCFKLMYKFKR